MAAVGFVAAGEINLNVGDPESKVIATLGQPKGKAGLGGKTAYMYDGGNIIIKDGKVESVPADFAESARQEEARKQAVYLAERQREDELTLQKARAAEEKRRFDELAQQARNREANGNKKTIELKGKSSPGVIVYP